MEDQNSSESGGGIFGVIGTVISSISNVIVGKQQKDIAHEQWLSSNPSTFKWFYQSDNEKDNSGLVIAGILGVVFIVIVGVIAIIKLRRNG